MKPFAPAWWLPNGHLQTIWASRVDRYTEVAFGFETYHLDDQDETQLAWYPQTLSLDAISRQQANTPIVLVLHGLEGSAESNYTRGLLKQTAALGWRGVVLHFRGCYGGPNKLDRSYHSGDTNDLRQLVQDLKARAPNAPILAVGYSLGGNVLLKYLGEYTEDAGIKAAVAVSVPFKLDHAADKLSQGMSKLYQHVLLSSLKQKFFDKFRDKPSPIDKAEVAQLKSIWAWDEIVTAPLHGFENAGDYYTRSSCYPFLPSVSVPTLLLHAVDDPLVPPSAIPLAHHQSEAITMECYPAGGHVAFVAGNNPAKPDYWLDKRVCEYLQAAL